MSDLLLNPTLAILNTFISFYRYDLLAISFFKYTFSFMYLFISCQGTFGESFWPDIQLQICNLRREEHLKICTQYHFSPEIERIEIMFVVFSFVSSSSISS